jgi:RNA polymerase sigma factor (TIGR02999 family)
LDVTELLHAWSQGDREALDRLMPLVYGELKRMAHRYLGRERGGHALQTTALVHEAYLKLVDQSRAQWQNRAQFFGVAAQLMRRILVDHARARDAAKRGAGAAPLSLDQTPTLAAEPEQDIVGLDQALTRLSELDPRQGRIVELRFFGGLSVEEAAEVLSLSPATIKREWAMAKAWLYRELGGTAA